MKFSREPVNSPVICILVGRGDLDFQPRGSADLEIAARLNYNA